MRWYVEFDAPMIYCPYIPMLETGKLASWWRAFGWAGYLSPGTKPHASCLGHIYFPTIPMKTMSEWWIRRGQYNYKPSKR